MELFLTYSNVSFQKKNFQKQEIKNISDVLKYHLFQSSYVILCHNFRFHNLAISAHEKNTKLSLDLWNAPLFWTPDLSKLYQYGGGGCEEKD